MVLGCPICVTQVPSVIQCAETQRTALGRGSLFPNSPSLRVKGVNQADNFSRSVTAPNHMAAVGALMDWIEERGRGDGLTAVGHRVVHGGPRYSKPQRITPEMVEELRRLVPFDPDHLPEEILLTEAFHRRFPDLPQVACFDTAFHHDLPRVAQQLPIPRRYEAQGVRRYGFHGLSYAFLMEELARLASAVSDVHVSSDARVDTPPSPVRWSERQSDS